MTTTAPRPATTRTSGAARPARWLSLGYLLVLSALVAVALHGRVRAGDR